MAVFSCRIKASLLNQLLTCFGPDLRKDQLCSIDASVTGLTYLMVGSSKSSQTQLTMPKGLFDNYALQGEESVRIIIDILLLIECSKLASNSELATATLSYSVEKALLLLSLEEANIMTVCEINCIQDEDQAEVGESMLEAFRSSAEQCQVIVKSDLLGDSVEEMIGAVGLATVVFDITPTYLKISSKGSAGSGDILVAKNLDAVVSFRCDAVMHQSYLIGSFLAGIKALTVSHEVCFRLNAEGIMYIQHQILTADGGEAYLNFLMLALDED